MTRCWSHYPPRQTARDWWRWLSPTIHHIMESILITDPWTIVLSHKKPHHRRVIYHQQLQWLSQWQDLCPLAPAHFALCLCYYPECKSVRLSPPYPGKPFCIRKPWCRFVVSRAHPRPPHPITGVPTSSPGLPSVTLFVTQGLATRWHGL